MMIRWEVWGTILLLAGCARLERFDSAHRRPPDDRLFAAYLEFMTRNQDALDELEHVRTDAEAKRLLAGIRANTIRARENRPRSLKGDLDRQFEVFLSLLETLEKKPWRKKGITILMDGCTRCHERPQ